MTSIWLVRRTRAILRSAEFGFLGVIVRTCRQTPRFCGAPGIDTWRCRRLFQFLRMAGALIFEILALAAVAHELADRRHEDAAPFGSLSGAMAVAADGPPALGVVAPGTARSGPVFWRLGDGPGAHAEAADPSRGHERGV